MGHMARLLLVWAAFLFELMCSPYCIYRFRVVSGLVRDFVGYSLERSKTRNEMSAVCKHSRSFGLISDRSMPSYGCGTIDS